MTSNKRSQFWRHNHAGLVKLLMTWRTPPPHFQRFFVIIMVLLHYLCATRLAWLWDKFAATLINTCIRTAIIFHSLDRIERMVFSPLAHIRSMAGKADFLPFPLMFITAATAYSHHSVSVKPSDSSSETHGTLGRLRFEGLKRTVDVTEFSLKRRRLVTLPVRR